MKDIIINQILPVVIDFTMVVILGVISSVRVHSSKHYAAHTITSFSLKGSRGGRSSSSLSCKVL